jgi:hypothetical protein
MFKSFSHQNKDKMFVEALQKRGYELTTNDDYDFLLIDHDLVVDGRRALIKDAIRKGKKVFLYPHAGSVWLTWDTGYKRYAPLSDISCLYVHSKGFETVFKMLYYPNPIQVTGWSLCEVLPFKPCTDLKSILFAPIHPYQYSKSLCKTDKLVNKEAFLRLYRFSSENNISLKVRHFGTLRQNGLPTKRDVEYITSSLDGSYDDIDKADLVVSSRTFLSLAVARGVPAIGMGIDVMPKIGAEGRSKVIKIKNWYLYKPYIMYPLDIMKGRIEDTIDLATRSDCAIKIWKDNFIGNPFDEDLFVSSLESYL